MNKHSLNESENQILDAIADSLSPELKILVVTGAGISADSGLPTYRGVGGGFTIRVKQNRASQSNSCFPAQRFGNSRN